MGLDEAGRHEHAAAAYRWLSRAQSQKGSWPAGYEGDSVSDPTVDLNFCSYVAAGVWHHYLATGDGAFLLEMWPTVEAALDLTLDHQRHDGAIHWALDPQGAVWPGALLTSSSCIYLSLGCGIRLAETIDRARPDWELSLGELRGALNQPQLFEDKDLFSMDWYYPVLVGAWDQQAAADRIASRWDDFVVDGLGVRCVSDRPWVTSGESSELVLALCAIDRRGEAATIFDWSQHLRKENGAYWTGATYPGGNFWPHEAPTWCAGAALLADAALSPESAISRILGDALQHA